MTLKSHIALGGDLMKTELKLAVILTAATLIFGCASGGGGMQHGETSRRPDSSTADTRTSNCVGFGCLFGGSSWPDDPVVPPKPFTSWPERQRTGGLVRFDAITSGVYYTKKDWYYSGSIESTNPANTYSSYWEGGPLYGANGTVSRLPNPEEGVDPYAFVSGESGFSTLAAIGQPGIDVATNGYVMGNLISNPFIAAYNLNIAVAGNPVALGWDYQSFGIWNSDRAYAQTITTSSYGAATPASAVPTAGSAAFTGKLAALYVSPTGQGSIAIADLIVNTNFSTRSLIFASSGTSITLDRLTATAAPNLNLSGTLTYSPGLSTFTGTLVNAGGTMSGSSKGQFYGPDAQELGGVFTVKSSTGVETLAGAYGAKR